MLLLATACSTRSSTPGGTSSPAPAADAGVAAVDAAPPIDAVAPAQHPDQALTVHCPDGTTQAGVPGQELWCADDQGARHGPALRWHDTGALAERGGYDHGLADGTWEV